MTLVEVMVALTIMGIAVGAALSLIGPWLTRERGLEREGRFWQDAQTAQLTVAELAAGAIDPAANLSTSTDAIRFRTYDPRMSSSPVDLTLKREGGIGGDALVVVSPNLPNGRSVLLPPGPPLQLRVIADRSGRPSSVLVLAHAAGAWSPIVMAPLPVNAQPTCVFDLISLACR